MSNRTIIMRVDDKKAIHIKEDNLKEQLSKQGLELTSDLSLNVVDEEKYAKSLRTFKGTYDMLRRQEEEERRRREMEREDFRRFLPFSSEYKATVVTSKQRDTKKAEEVVFAYKKGHASAKSHSNMLWDLFDNLGNRFSKRKENLPKHDKVYVREDAAEGIVNQYDIQKEYGE